MMTITEHCDKCNNTWRCDDENTPDRCPYCGYDGEDDDTAGEVDCDVPDNEDLGDEAADFGGMDIPDTRF